MLVVGVLLGCGGRVDDGGSTSTPRVGCDGACDHFGACTTPFPGQAACVKTCASEYPDAAQAATYGACIQAVSCEDLQRGLYADYGPIGACHEKARVKR
jgi:hypothetical protein